MQLIKSQIQSVKRTRDNKVFKIGDRIPAKGEISEFKIGKRHNEVEITAVLHYNIDGGGLQDREISVDLL